MPFSDYTAAFKQGKRSYMTALSRGEYPYLPVLDDILSYTEIVATIPLGLMNIPLSKIVGTKTQGRTNAFANDFMPLLSEKSEFASKWAHLYDSQIDEGIRDPIVAFEFMNRFYVQEGNKRVSVMKYLGTYSIPGTVTRLVPKKTDDKENRLYYEFLDFYEVSHYCDIWFTREGSYKKLLKLMGKDEGEEWSEDDTQFFRVVNGRFAKAFQMAHGDKLVLNVSDAFLIYVEVYGYEQMKEQSEREILHGLQDMWEEIMLADKGGQVALVQSPEEAKELQKPSLLNRLIPEVTLASERLKIAYIYPKTAETSSWTYAHELGRLYVEQTLEEKIETMVIDKANTEEEVEEAIEEAVAAGCTLIFTTAVQMVNQSVRSAIRHPKVRIFNCSIKMSYSSICTYYARMYESKFLMGAIAAALSKTDRLGYVADYPIYGTMANINAFALGARLINPDVRIQLEWSRVENQNAREKLKQEGVVCISDDDMITPQHASREYGLYAKAKDGSLENIATPIWHWGKFYEQIINSILHGDSDVGAQKGKKAVNYWWGMSADVIDVICSKTMPHGTHRLIEFLKSSIRAGSFHPFDGIIYSQNGVVRCEEGKTLSPEEIVTMDWLAENVVGKIPEYDELTEEARELVQLQGVRIDETNTEK